MAFDDLEGRRIERIVGGLCNARTPEHVREKLSLEYRVNGHDVVLFERRPPWDGRPGFMETPVAKMKFVRSVGEWRLYWMRRDLKWHRYEPLPASPELKDLIGEVDRDPFCCFFG